VADMVPSGPQWVHEIKHDGFRFICKELRTRASSSKSSRKIGLRRSAAGPAANSL
jgi:ATP-dependent DNA ligase